MIYHGYTIYLEQYGFYQSEVTEDGRKGLDVGFVPGTLSGPTYCAYDSADECVAQSDSLSDLKRMLDERPVITA